MTLFVYAFLSNVALALVPHEPVVIWYGRHLGLWPTALIATAGTVAAAWLDHRLFVPLFAVAVGRHRRSGGPLRILDRLFNRAPFAIITAAGLAPLPFFPIKVLAFAARYPRGRYLGAVLAGRLPRYVLLAWLGIAVAIPAWALITLFVLLTLLSLGAFACRPHNGS